MNGLLMNQFYTGFYDGIDMAGGEQAVGTINDYNRYDGWTAADSDNCGGPHVMGGTTNQLRDPDWTQLDIPSSGQFFIYHP
jgi:hypothetical protein